MKDQPEALRLAYALETGRYLLSVERDATAAELRRLHQFAEDQIGRATAAEAALQMTKATHALKIAAVEAQRDALLEAMKEIVAAADGKGWEQIDPSFKKARAAIAEAEGEKR